MSLSWEPVRTGDKYCAPACGGGCTVKMYEAAKAQGAAMLKDLKDSKGWKVEIKENLGWHVCLRKGSMSLYLDDGRYHVLFCTDKDSIGGSSVWTENYYHADPNKVLARQLRVARAYVRKCLEAIELAET